MAHEMEPSLSQIAHLGSFAIEFLDVVFAEVAHPKSVSLADDGGREHFCDGDQRDLIPSPPGPASRPLDARFYFFQPVSKHVSNSIIGADGGRMVR